MLMEYLCLRNEPYKNVFCGICGTIVGLSVLTIMKLLLWDVDNWRILLTNFLYVDFKLQSKRKLEGKLVNNFYFGFFVK
jgi:hypothetical protein